MTELKNRHSSSQNGKKKSESHNHHVDDDNEKKVKPDYKNYVHRNSVLTDLMDEVNHFQTVLNISIAIFGYLMMVLTMYYIADPQSFYKDVNIMVWSMKKLDIMCLTWIGFCVECLVVYKVFCIWAQYRRKLSTIISDFLFIAFFIAVSTSMFILAPYVVIEYDFGLITAFILLIEQVRMFMKIYSFVVENFSKMKTLSNEAAKTQDVSFVPSFKHFLYFMIAPVLIYKDHYPQTKTRNWNFIALNFMKVFACIFIAYCYVLRFNLEIFSQIGLRTFTAKELVLVYVGCTAAGTFTMFLIFYMLLHSWLNAFAEITKFGDRQFYKDWWNSTSFGEYYRTWNVVVYDWIYRYFYVHLTKLGLNKKFCMMLVLIVSSIFHDYIICFALGYFFPALGAVYSTVGFILIVVTRNGKSTRWNIFVHFMLYSGWGVLIFMFSGEWYARKNCPSAIEGPLKHIVPRIFSCQLLESPT